MPLPTKPLACRLWARSAFYQSGGAFAATSLQDAAALLYYDPQLTRQQLLLHAAHQFVEGDVLHWWHPPLSQRIRTRFSDDLLWLPYLAAFYAHATGDWSLFGEPVPFARARWPRARTRRFCSRNQPMRAPVSMSTAAGRWIAR